MKARSDPQYLYGTRCKNCPFARNGAPNRPVLGEGPADPVGILVGESPGPDETEAGRPFVGATGRQLDESLRKVGLDRDKLFVVNAICCQPSVLKSEHQMQKAVTCCKPALVGQLADHWGKHVFAMGKWAFFAMTKQTRGITVSRGFIRPLDFP